MVALQFHLKGNVIGIKVRNGLTEWLWSNHG